MKLKIMIDGVLYDMPDTIVPDGWDECVNCEDCFLSYRKCNQLCYRVFMERKRRAKNQQQGESDHGSNHQA